MSSQTLITMENAITDQLEKVAIKEKRSKSMVVALALEQYFNKR